MHQSDQIILKDCSYLLLEKCLCGGSTCSFKAFSFPTCGVHSHAPVAQFQPSCQNASDASSPKTGGAEAGNLPPEPNQYLDSFRRQSLRWLSHLAASFAPVCFPKLLFVQFQELAPERFLPEGNDKRRVLEKKLSPFGSEDCESEGCVSG